MLHLLSHPGPIVFCQVRRGPSLPLWLSVLIQSIWWDTRLVWEISLYKQTPRLHRSPVQQSASATHYNLISATYLPLCKISQIPFPVRQINKTDRRHHYSLLMTIWLKRRRQFTKSTCNAQRIQEWSSPHNSHGKSLALLAGAVGYACCTWKRG